MMNFTWSSSLCGSLSGGASLIFLSWHAAPSFLCAISLSQIRLLCPSLLCRLRESQSWVAAPMWACKYPPQLITTLEQRATGSLSVAPDEVRISGEGAGMSELPPKTKGNLSVCSSTVKSTFSIGQKRAAPWCISVWWLFVPLCVCEVVPGCRCVLWSHHPRTVHVLTVIDDTIQKQREGSVIQHRGD